MDSKDYNSKQRNVIVKSYKLKELADFYQVSNYLMRKLIAKHKRAIGKREGYYYRPDQVVLIFDLIKPPSNVKII